MLSVRSETFFVRTGPPGQEVFFPKKSSKGPRRVRRITTYAVDELAADPYTLQAIGTKTEATLVRINLRLSKDEDIATGLPINCMNRVGTKHSGIQFNGVLMDTDFSSVIVPLSNNLRKTFVFQFDYE